jgi:hypothetical protein
MLIERKIIGNPNQRRPSWRITLQSWVCIVQFCLGERTVHFPFCQNGPTA